MKLKLQLKPQGYSRWRRVTFHQQIRSLPVTSHLFDTPVESQRMGWGDDPSISQLPKLSISTLTCCFNPGNCNKQWHPHTYVSTSTPSSLSHYHSDLRALQGEKSFIYKWLDKQMFLSKEEPVVWSYSVIFISVTVLSLSDASFLSICPKQDFKPLRIPCRLCSSPRSLPLQLIL